MNLLAPRTALAGTTMAIAVIGSSALTVPAAAGDPIHPKVHPAVTFEDGTAKVIVCVLGDNAERPRDCDGLRDVLDLIPAANVAMWDCPDAIAATLTPEQAVAVANSPFVYSIEPEMEFHPTLVDVVEIVRAVEAWQCVAAEAGLVGRGGTVAVVDTGIDFSHRDLAAKNIAGFVRDCNAGIDCPPDPTTGDWSGHGTHVAGIAGASGGISGIGPGVDFIALKVFPDGQPTTPLLPIKRAVRWATEHRDEYNIVCISMSLGTHTIHADHCDPYNTALVNAVNDAAAAGIAVIAATGNNGSEDRITAPACITGAIPVSSTTKDGERSSFANYNDLVKLFAPGSLIQSTCAGGGYCLKSGTSMSTPAVSGAYAVMYQLLAAIGVEMTPHDIEQIFFETGAPIVDLPFDRWRRIDLQAAIAMLIDQAALPGDVTLDGTVDAADLTAVLTNWGVCGEGLPCQADIDRNGVVDFTDLVTVLADWT